MGFHELGLVNVPRRMMGFASRALRQQAANTLRPEALMLLTVLAATTGCTAATNGDPGTDSSPDGSGAVTMADVRANGLPHVGQVTSALDASTCTNKQRDAAVRGQEILLRAVIDATNAYSANTNNARAMEFFGARDEQQTLTVFYNLLWAYQTLLGDEQTSSIVYSCNSAWICPPGNIAWSETPNVTTVCDPNDPFFWQAVPYVMAHEMWHWLGWGDPTVEGLNGDSAEAVHLAARKHVDVAIQMPHAYYLYLIEFIQPWFTEAIYEE